MIRVGINGFGRIGRTVLRVARRPEHRERIEVVAVNDLFPSEQLAYLFRYDSVMGPYEGTVTAERDALIVDGRRLALSAQKSPAAIPWREHDVDVVGMARVLAEQRAAAAPAERAHAVLGGAVMHQHVRAGLEREPLARDAEPGDEGGAVVAPAHRAVAVRTEQRRRRHPKADRPAQAPTAHRRGNGNGDVHCLVAWLLGSEEVCSERVN